MISKEEFCKYIDDLKRVHEIDNAVYETMRNLGGLIELPDDCYRLSADVIELLARSFIDIEPKVDWIAENIDYFCYELEFGTLYKPGMVTDKNADGEVVNIDFSTGEKLYEYLAKEYGKNESI